ncbi:MAG: N-acetyl-gamma-glutamyl-phosphate reductase [Flavitalea sp.]
MQKVKVSIIGGAGYTGGELIRLLINHPFAEIINIFSRSNAGNPVHSVHNDLLGDTDLSFDAEVSMDADVYFFCMGHGDSRKFLQEYTLPATARIIDLSNDFRLKDSNSYGEKTFIYGLPELNREKIKGAQYVANPGCFASAIQLGLLPLAQAGELKNIYTTGITGSTGAGQGLAQTSHFSWRANNIQAYKTLTHQHLGEIGESISQLQPDAKFDLSFVPWRGDFTRGIFISSQIDCGLEGPELIELYDDFYKDAAFTYMSSAPIFLKQVVNTNKCLIQLEKVGTKLVVHSIIDNLLKGASGQAVQNMNLMFGFEETEGLKLKANYF